MTTLIERKEAVKEDIEHVLEELWDLEEEEPLYKIFTRECLGSKSIQEMLQCSIAELKGLLYRHDDYAVLYLQKYDVGKSA